MIHKEEVRSKTLAGPNIVSISRVDLSQRQKLFTHIRRETNFAVLQ